MTISITDKFLQYLKLRGVSVKSLKYYKSDLTSFLTWAGVKKIEPKLIQEYINSIRAFTPVSTLNRRISTLKSYGSFMGFKKVSSTWQDNILSKFGHKPKFQNILHKLFFSRPNWYRKYHSYPVASYIHIAILVLFTSLSGYALYDQVFRNPENPLAFPTALTRPNRFLSFQGRLTDNLGNPKTVATNMVFKLYSVSTAGVALWDSGTCSITPDQDGIFSTLLGSSCGAEIAATVFSENASVWVGVTVAADAEATPRVQIATVAYALNSETLQGYPAGTGTSTIPYINSTGALVLANASPTIQSTSGTFAVEGLAMTITTPNTSNGVITVNPDGVGTLDLTFEGAAAGLSANGFVNATNANITSGALYGGTVASAATGYNFIDFQSGVSPASKFSVSAVGNTYIAGTLGVGGTPAATALLDLTSTTKGFLAPRMTTIQRDAITTPATGLMIYNTSDNQYNVFNGTTWGAVGGGGGGAWSDITLPTGNLAFSMGGYTTAFTWTGGGKFAFDTNGNLGIGTNSATHAVATADVLISSDLEVDGVLYMDGGIIANSAGTTSIVLSATPTTVANTLSASNWLIENTANVGQAALIINQQKAGDLFTASASGTPKFTIANTGAITSAIGSWTSQVADSATAVGFTFNTSNTLSTQGSKLMSFQNLGTEKMYLDKDGNLYVSGTVVSGNGTSMLLTNKSGGIVASKAIVVLDTSNNTSFTTTTTPYSKSGFGVVVGVGLGVTNDADGDGVCDADDICMIAYGGSVNVTVKNATTATKGDYLFTSDTAGSAVASAKQYDGLVGIVDDTTNAASGYLRMIFKVQPQVTAAAAIDKGTKHNEYWLYADQYQAVGEGANTDTNLLNRGLAFDTFTDSTKTDSANTTASLDTNTQKTGLIGGQTLATSTTDNDGQTYLGSNTVNDQYLYDRTRDSAPQVQVELGIDPNWYNGVTLSVATTSAQFSQNSTITKPNPNLSTTYNGSLIKVTGTDTTPRTIYITIKSPTTFDWTNYNGQAATGVTMTPGTAQALGTTGVSANFTNARYNTGDVFKIASWFIEAESSTRGAKQQFPERSNIIATASSVDIIDADTQKLWMRFSQGTSYAIGVDANNDPSSANMLNGKAYISTNGSAATGLYTLDFVHDAAFKQNATDYRLSDTALYGRNGTNTYNVINTSNILVNITANDVSAAVIPNQPTQTVTVSGWGYILGNDGVIDLGETVNLPYKFNDIPRVEVTATGDSSTTVPTNLSSCNLSTKSVFSSANTITNSSFSARTNSRNASVVLGTIYYCYTWTATGQVSPRQFVAVNTNGGQTVINETDQTSANNSRTSAGTIIAITSNNALYYGEDGAFQVLAQYGIAGGWSTSGYNAYFRGQSPSGARVLPLWNTDTSVPTKIAVSEGTSTADGKSNTIYLSHNNGLTAIQEVRSMANDNDGGEGTGGSVKYYTKDYISEEMVGNVQGMWGFNSALTDSSVKAATITAGGATITYPTAVRGKGINITVANGTVTTTTIGANYSMGIWVKETTGWTHYVKTNAGTYINGVLSSTAFTNRMTWVTTTVTLVAGTQDVDEMFATNTTMTPGQIKHMYEVGYRALQSHATTLGGGAADTNQQLGGTTNVIGDAKPDYNNQFMYVGTNSTTLGAVSKIDLNSDTNIKTYNSSANVPTGGPLLIDEDTKSLAVGYNLEAVGSAASGVKTMGVDNNATATSGNFIGKTITTAESFNQAYLWAQYTLDASDASNTIEVWASNDGGSNYSQCNLTNTDSSRSPSEYEYFCQFNTAGSSLKTKFVMARGSTKTNTYVTKYGISWIDSNAVAGSANGSGLFTGSNASVANGSYIDVAHNQNSNDLVTNGWVYNTATSKWEMIDTTSNEQATSSAQVNYNTEANYTQENMAYAVTLTPSATSGNITLTLGSGTWNSDARIQAGCRVTGNGGVADITAAPAAQTTITATTTTNFTNTDAIASGSWQLYCTTFDGSVAKINTGAGGSPDSYTKALLHMNGTDASTTFTDEIGKTWTRRGSAQIDTAISKFDGAAGLFNGTTDYVDTPDHADFDVAAGEFTVDAWFNRAGGNGTQRAIYGQGTGADATISMWIELNASNVLDAFVVVGGTFTYVTGTTTFTSTGWHHVAFVRTGNTLKLFVDGVQEGGNVAFSGTVNNSAYKAAIGTAGEYTGTLWNGSIDEFRFSKGVARWTTNFTPQTTHYGPIPTSQNYSVVTNSDQMTTASWDHVENAVVTETLNSQTINYSVSFDGRTTFAIYDSTTSNNGWRPIARNNSGTWQYNSNTTAGVSNVTWTSATYNSQNGALSQATGVTQNQMTGTQLNALTAVNWREINGFTPTTNTLDFAASLKTTSASQIPQVDQIKVNYTQAGMKIVQTDANTVRLYNYSGAAQNLRLDVITGGLGRNAGTVSLAPAAADVDSQTSTNSLWINKTGTGGNLLKLQTGGADMTLINNLGDITGGITTLDGSTTANGAGTASTTLILTSATNFDVGNYVKVSSTSCATGVNVCYAKITAIATNTLTISPALTWANASAVVEVHVPELGGIDTSQALVNRYGRGYFVDGIVAGNGSTYFTDNLISFGGGSKIQDASGKLQLQAGGTGTGSTGTGSIYFLNSSGETKARLDTSSLNANFGTGVDGAITVTAAKNLNTEIIGASRSTYADGIAYRVIAPADSATSVTRYSGSDTISNGIVAGDEVLLINFQGATGDQADVGNYEFKIVSSITASTITFTTAITKSFDGTTASNQKVVVQRVPQYTDVTLSDSGSLTASAWDALATTPTGAAGYYTGTVAFRATGTVTVGNGTSITVAAKGYRGGAGNDTTGYQGESRKGTGSASTAANDGGGGGGNTTNYSAWPSGGAGGGYSAAGSNGTTNAGWGTGGTGGSGYGATTLSSLFFGSGGGGSSHQTGGYGTGTGGTGGGIIFVYASTITVSGTILTNAGDPSPANTNGGGGAGGSAYIVGSSVTLGSSLVTASGTNGTSQGGDGSSGRIRVEYISTLSGTTSPAASEAFNSGYGSLYLASTNTSSSDLAEYYVAGDKTISAGDVVSISNTKVLDDGGEEVTNQGVMRKANKPYDSKLIGIISTNPGVLMGSIDGDTGKEDKRMLALSGRVPVKIDPDSESIETGDFLTSSDKPGLAKKATQAGYTVGKALESWDPSTSSGSATIEAFVNLGYHDPDLQLTDTGDIQITASASGYIAKNTATDNLIDRIGAFTQLVAANIRAGLIESKVIKTNIISPIANTDLIIDLQPDNATESARLVIKGKDDEIVTSFDAEGNATISGTLYADKIESERLNAIEELLTEVETNQALLTEASLWNTDTATASGQFTELFVTGQAAISSLFVSDNFTTKNINSLTEPLSIQSLASAPLEIMAGKIIIDTDGNTKFLGNVEIAGDLTINNIIVANNIDPTATESGTIVEGEINTNATAGKAILTAGSEKVRINNNKVSLNTLIYITPITSTQNKVLFVKAKDTGFFDIGFSDTLDTDVEFNWWIIELQ